MADSNNRSWRTRTPIPSKYWNESHTYYDTDGQPISTNNTMPQPVPKYSQEVCGEMKHLEDLIWLISENKDQAILVLHQFRQGTK